MNQRKQDLARYVKALRENHQPKRLNQRELANRLGVSYTYISKIENGHIEILPSVEFLKKLADVGNDSYLNVMAAAGKVDHIALDSYLDNVPQVAVLLWLLIENKASKDIVNSFIDDLLKVGKARYS